MGKGLGALRRVSDLFENGLEGAVGRVEDQFLGRPKYVYPDDLRIKRLNLASFKPLRAWDGSWHAASTWAREEQHVLKCSWMHCGAWSWKTWMLGFAVS